MFIHLAIAFLSFAAHAQSLSEDISPCLVTLDQSYRFYNYANIDGIKRTLEPNGSLTDAVQNHVMLWSEYYWNPSHGNHAGLYTSADPIGARDYGDNGSDGKFYLYRVQIPAGDTYLDLKTSSRCTMSPETQQTLSAAGCSARNLNELVSAGPNSESCAQYLRPAFQALRLRGWAYPWNEASLGCHKRTGETFVWIDLSNLPKESIANFSNSVPQAEPLLTEAVEIEKLFESARLARWADLGPEMSKGRPLEQIKRETLLGCE